MQASKEISNKITKINSLIEVKTENKLFNHFKYSFSAYKVYGSIQNNTFVLWKYDRSWTGIFYPVIKGQFLTDHHGSVQLKLKPQLNILGKVLNIVLIGLIGFPMLNEMIPSNSSFSEFFGLIFLISIFILFLQIVPWACYRTGKKDMIELINKTIN